MRFLIAPKRRPEPLVNGSGAAAAFICGLAAKVECAALSGFRCC